MGQTIAFDPTLPWSVIAALAAVSALVVAVALFRRLGGWWLRALAALALLVALANPSLRDEDRQQVADIAVVLVDESASNRLPGRPEQTAAALEAVEAELARIGQGQPLETEVVRVADGGDAGTRLLGALAEATAELPAERVAGAVLITDGQVHDPEALRDFPGPVHVLLTGREADWDRRVVVETAPAFAIVDEPVELRLRVEDLGAAPAAGGEAEIAVALDGGAPMRVSAPLNRTITLPVTLARGGQNVLEISTPAVEGELTDRNNAAIVTINGVRDRLRVLLVSGEPYPGERTWRNLLKSDSAVDLVHFTILRPPDKQDFVPVFELSLIAFPTQELFMEKVDEFDLIIFDRYKRRGILPNNYFENIVRYVREGGALLVSSGEEIAGADSLARSPLDEILPVAPTARVFEEGYVPGISAVGARHPVTAGLAELGPRPVAEDGTPGWGRWFRMADVDTRSGVAVMDGPEDRPLLVLDHQGEGRVAMLTSDQAWLWSRGFEGGGPQAELLRRLAHWLMQEPQLEEETLSGARQEDELILSRRTLAEAVAPAVVTSPSGEVSEVDLVEVAPGRWEGRLPAAENGVWRLAEGELEAVAVVGPRAPREFADPVSTGVPLGALAGATGGGIKRLEAGAPDIRMVREGRPTEGRGWIGLTAREAYQLRDVRQVSLAPGWLMLALSAGLIFAAWRVEGR